MRRTIAMIIALLLTAFPLYAAGATSQPTSQPTDEELASHAAALRDRLPANFTIVIQKPFVVIGDEAPPVVKRRAEQTVGWAVKKLKSAYFSRDPDRILNVWLFKDSESYERNAKEMFGSRPSTPYGYYSSTDDALVMNIATGGGTLVHEIVHPFIEANFPDCPAWFNEGLGSLYEQSAERNREIVGLPNWRLSDLQKAVRAGTLLSLHDLMHLSTEEFYGDDRGNNYAEARYLCLYLQDRGLLQQFYKRFVEQHADDPTGFDSLKAVLGVDDLKMTEAAFKQFVLKLKFP